MRFAPALLGAFALFGAAGPAAAWGDLGHEVTALIAYRHLTPTARAKLDGLLTSDADSLTAPDFASRATWADKYRNGHRETSEWHFVDLEIDRPDLAKACSGFPRLMPGQVASAGPAKDCVIDKIEAFDAELRSPATAPAERLLALKFLVHFVGDLHQPLHASDHNDHGGNCIGLAPALDGKDNLHACWDTAAVEAMGGSASDIAARLNAKSRQLILRPGAGETLEAGRWNPSRCPGGAPMRCRAGQSAWTMPSSPSRPRIRRPPRPTRPFSWKRLASVSLRSSTTTYANLPRIVLFSVGSRRAILVGWTWRCRGRRTIGQLRI